MSYLTQKHLDHVTNKAQEMFPHDPYLRVLHYSREATMAGRLMAHYSPKMVTPFIIGHGGYGKTSKMREYARKMGLGYRERQLAGITDVAEILGLSRVNPATGLTETAPPAWWPNENDEPEGMIVWDDWTRGLPHIIDAIMQLMINGEYNGLRLPDGWTMVCTGNPDEGYAVRALDPAQLSRMLVMAYNRPNEVFFEQLELQDVDADLKNLWMKDQSQVDAPALTLERPPSNDRTKMIFARVYPYLKQDDQALQIVGRTMFGEGFITAIATMKSEYKPIEPEQVLAGDAVEEIEKYLEAKRSDMVALSTLRMVHHMNTRSPEDFTEEQYKNIASWGMVLPQSDATLFVQKVMSTTNGGRGMGYSQKLITATRVGGKNGPFAQRIVQILENARKRQET